jgi:TonB family protein
MNLLLETTIKISLVVAIGLLAAWLFRRRSAALRHWLLAASMVGALATPLLIRLAPSWSLPVAAPVVSTSAASGRAASAHREPQVSVATIMTVESGNTASPSTRIDPLWALLAIWSLGVVINLAGLLVGFWRLHRLSARATSVDAGPWANAADALASELNLRTPVRLLQSDRPALLVTWGFFRPTVMLPAGAASWATDRIRAVLAHELAHVKRHDWIIQIGSELVRIANWFNPLVWLAAARLRLESERACDDAVVSLGVSGREYAEHLLELARQFGRARHEPLPAVAVVPRPSHLEQRVRAMLNTQLSRRPITAAARLTTLAALLLVALPIALFAQNSFATLSGSVGDPSGAAMPGVIVVATDRDRQVRHQVRTDATGRFELIGLPQGSYALRATLPGFESFEEQLMISGEDVRRDITLSIGTLQETISVSNTPGGGTRELPGPGQRYKPRPVAECGGAPAASFPRPRIDGAVRIGGQIRAPAKLRHVSPVYPNGSSAGVVVLQATIGPDGYVRETEVLRDPSAALSQAAVDAVKQWEFEPTLLNCVPVPVRMIVTVQFG